jgi:hypothetical protein
MGVYEARSPIGFGRKQHNFVAHRFFITRGYGSKRHLADLETDRPDKSDSGSPQKDNSIRTNRKSDAVHNLRTYRIVSRDDYTER